MTALTVFIAAGYLGIGLNRALAYDKARRRWVDTLLADPSSAAASALHLRLALDMLPTWGAPSAPSASASQRKEAERPLGHRREC